MDTICFKLAGDPIRASPITHRVKYSIELKDIFYFFSCAEVVVKT